MIYLKALIYGDEDSAEKILEATRCPKSSNWADKFKALLMAYGIYTRRGSL